MTRATAIRTLAILRPDVKPEWITGLSMRAYGWIAVDDSGGSFCLITGGYTPPLRDPAERFGGDER